MRVQFCSLYTRILEVCFVQQQIKFGSNLVLVLISKITLVSFIFHTENITCYSAKTMAKFSET